MNPLLRGVLDVRDFNEQQSGQRTLDDDRLETLIEVLESIPAWAEGHGAGYSGDAAYEYLLRKFAEDQGQSAGEFYTPKEVSWLMAANYKSRTVHHHLRSGVRIGRPAHQTPLAI